MFTILSVIIWILAFDFGIGNGLRNKLVGASYNKDKAVIKSYMSSSYIILGSVTVILFLILMPMTWFANWNILLNISTTVIDGTVLRNAGLLILAAIITQFFLRLISFIVFSLQKSAINNL